MTLINHIILALVRVHILYEYTYLRYSYAYTLHEILYAKRPHGVVVKLIFRGCRGPAGASFTTGV
jgi:hypothetical protein